MPHSSKKRIETIAPSDRSMRDWLDQADQSVNKMWSKILRREGDFSKAEFLTELRVKYALSQDLQFAKLKTKSNSPSRPVTHPTQSGLAPKPSLESGLSSRPQPEISLAIPHKPILAQARYINNTDNSPLCSKKIEPKSKSEPIIDFPSNPNSKSRSEPKLKTTGTSQLGLYANDAGLHYARHRIRQVDDFDAMLKSGFPKSSSSNWSDSEPTIFISLTPKVADSHLCST